MRTEQTRVRTARLIGGLFAIGLVALVVQGCAESLPIEFVLEPDGGSPAMGATGGSSSTGGQTGSGGNFGTGGDQGTGGFGTGGVNGTGGSTGGSFGTGGSKATGGSTGTGGFGLGTGGMRATGGSTGTGGIGPGTGGITGGGGMRATGGTTGAGGTGAGGAGGSAPTFTEVYQMILSVSCTGSQCHNPGSQGGVSMSSQSTAYSSLKNRVSAGNATGSTLYTLVNNGSMPPGKKLSSSQISMIADWINAGALNN
jgi:hypothetical protein